MTAVGVASPTAQGQAMTSVAMPKLSAKMKWLLFFGTQSLGNLSVRPAAGALPDHTGLYGIPPRETFSPSGKVNLVARFHGG